MVSAYSARFMAWSPIRSIFPRMVYIRFRVSISLGVWSNTSILEIFWESLILLKSISSSRSVMAWIPSEAPSSTALKLWDTFSAAVASIT